MCRMNHFYFCCSSKEGSYASAVLTGLVIIIYGIMGLLRVFSAENDKDTAEQILLMVSGIIYLVMACILLVVTASLCVSLHQDRARYMIPYLFFLLIVMGFTVIVIIIGIIIKCYLDALLLFVLAYEIYTWLIVFSYYKLLRRRPPLPPEREFLPATYGHSHQASRRQQFYPYHREYREQQLVIQRQLQRQKQLQQQRQLQLQQPEQEQQQAEPEAEDTGPSTPTTEPQPPQTSDTEK